MIKFLIHRPIAVLMTALGIVVLGVLAMNYVPVSLMPDIDIQEVTVQVSAKNNSAQEVESSIMRPLRNSLLQVSNLEDIKSESYNGFGTIKLNFAHGSNIDYTFIEVNEKIDRAMSSLPKSVERPKVIKASASDIPVFYLNVSLKNKNPEGSQNQISKDFLEFSGFTEKIIKKRIEQLPEVALVDINGITNPEVVIIPDADKCRALGVDLNEIEEIVKKQQIDVGSILVKDSQYQYNLRLGTLLNGISDIENIFFNKNDKLYQLKDIATVFERPQKRKGLVISNGKEAISLAIIKQSNARIQDLKESLNRGISEMKKDYPDVNFEISRDQTKLLSVAIDNLSQSLFWGVLLAFTVMFFFLKDVRLPLLIGISVPISIITCLLFFHLLEISINIISLSGLILGIGLMIDNAIIVIDNITQYKDRGNSLSDSCVDGAQEVFRPMLSSVLTTTAVFIPLIFLSGITGALFYDQAMAITIGLFVSLLISITLLPVIYRLFYLKEKKVLRINSFIQKFSVLDYEGLYEKGLHFFMRRQLFSFMMFFCLISVSVFLFFTLPKSTMPSITSAETFLKIDWNESINAEENKKRILLLTQTIQDSIQDYNAFVGEQQFLLGKNSETKTQEVHLYLKMSSEQKLNEVKKVIADYLHVNYRDPVYEFSQVDNIFNAIFSENNAPLIVKLRDQNKTGQTRNTELKKLWNSINRKLPNLEVQPLSWEENIVLLADKKKMILYGVSTDELHSSLKSAFNEKEIISLTNNQNYTPVILGGTETNIKNVLAVTQIKSNDTTYFYVGDFIREIKSESLRTITAGKDGQYYEMALNVTSNEKPILEAVKEVVNQDKEFDVSFSGTIFENRGLINELLIVLGITLLLLFFILASQFESLMLPFIILIEIPIAAAGALLLLYLFDYSLNLMSMIGIVVMSGIIINDSILKIDTIIQLQKKGNGLIKSIVLAGKRRLKPILMTSLTTILALVPILFSSGLGAELQAPLAVALIGGMVLGTIVSLYLIPLCYFHFSKKKKYARV